VFPMCSVDQLEWGLETGDWSSVDICIDSVYHLLTQYNMMVISLREISQPGAT
jgi:hypothetical protein